VIDHRVPLTHNEAMTLPSADLWRQAEEAEIKSLNGNDVFADAVTGRTEVDAYEVDLCHEV